MSDLALPPIKALVWRCRRGMRELDQLLLGYLEDAFPEADSAQQADFVRLLDLQDPVIFGFLVRREQPDDLGLQRIVRDILDTAQSRKIRT